MPTFTERQRAFLDQPLNAVVATLRQDGVPSQSIVWYARDGNSLWLSVHPESVKARHVAREPRLSMLIFSADGGGYLRIEGPATRDGEVDAALRHTLISRYVGAENAEAWLAERPLASPNARLRIVPAHIVEHNIDGVG